MLDIQWHGACRWMARSRRLLTKSEKESGLVRCTMYLHTTRVGQKYNVAFPVSSVLRNVTAKSQNDRGTMMYYLSDGWGWYSVAVNGFTPSSLQVA